VEPLNIAWLEDMITGDYTPYVDADIYRDVTQSTSTPIHTGEQIYLRQNFKSLIEGHAVNVVGPDPCDVGGIAELKWIAEYADLHGILMAPHGTGDGLFGLAALVQVCATLPHNYIAFEYPIGNPGWWHEIVEGLPEPIVENGFIDVDAWTRPGMGLDFKIEAAKARLRPEDADFFD
jgi:L-alanine-DL-glutamate epimerase-like enolase superfamily enzyme